MEIGHGRVVWSFAVGGGLALILWGIDTLGAFGWLRSGVDVVVNPVSSRVYAVVSVVDVPIQVVRFAFRGSKLVSDLENRLNAALVDSARVSSLEEENKNFRELLGADLPDRFEFIPVAVAGAGDEMILVGGRNLGISGGESVVDAAGVLVGKVVRVTGRTSYVDTPQKSGVRVPVKLSRSGVLGLLVGQGGNAILEEVTQGQNLESGELIVTVSKENLYVPGLVVGTINQVVSNESEVNKRALVNLAYGDQLASMVFVIRGSGETN